MAFTEGAAALGASAISAGGSLAGSIVNYFATKKNNEMQYEYNKKLSEQAYKQNVEQWMRENAYNTPAMQVARMRAAGINPNTAFGSGVDANSGNAAASPQLGYGQYNPQAPYFDMNSPIQNALSAYLLEAKRENINADTGLKTGQTQETLQRTQNLEVEYHQRKAALYGAQLDNQSKEIALKYLDKQKAAELAYTEGKVKLNAEQEKQVKYITDNILPKEVQLKDKSIQDFDKKWNKWHAEIEKWAHENAKTDAEAQNLILDAENYALNHMNSGFMGTGISLPNMGRFGKSVNEGLKRSSKKIGDAITDSAKSAWRSGKEAANRLKFW